MSATSTSQTLGAPIPPSTITAGTKLSTKERKALVEIELAEKDKNRWSFFSSNSKYEDAAEHYVKAGNLFRVSRNWIEAGRAFMQAAEMCIKTNSNHQAANWYVKAANAFRKNGPKETIMCLDAAINMYTDAGRFHLAAKYQQEVAELFEEQLQLEEAINAYEVAAEYFDGDNSKSQATKCLLKVAEFSAQLEKYARAIEIYEQVGINSLGNNLLKWGARTHFLRAGLCRLAQEDSVGAQRAIERYQDLDCSFSSQRECKLLVTLTKAVVDFDVETFTNTVIEYDSLTKLDSWTTTILLRIKNTISDEDAPPSAKEENSTDQKVVGGADDLGDDLC